MYLGPSIYLTVYPCVYVFMYLLMCFFVYLYVICECMQDLECLQIMKLLTRDAHTGSVFMRFNLLPTCFRRGKTESAAFRSAHSISGVCSSLIRFCVVSNVGNPSCKAAAK